MKHKNITGFLLLIFLLAQFPLAIQFSVGVPTELVVPKTKDEPLIVTGLLGTTITWEIKRSFGLFASDEAFHTQDQLRYKVIGYDKDNNNFQCNVSRKSWFNESWYKYPNEVNSTTYIVARHWGNVAVDQITELINYWYVHPRVLKSFVDAFSPVPVNMTGQEILNQFNENKSFRATIDVNRLIDYTYIKIIDDWTSIEYGTQFLGTNIITVVLIDIVLDAKNYVHLNFTRSEGILLSKDLSLNIINGSGPLEDISGSIALEFLDIDGYELAVSPWFYVLWTSVIVGGLFLTIAIISILVNRRQRRLLLDADY